MQESKTKAIVIQEISNEVFCLLLQYLYTDEIDRYASLDDVIELLMLANQYNLSRLVQLCESLLTKKVDTTNVIPLETLCEFHQAGDVKS